MFREEVTYQYGTSGLLNQVVTEKFVVKEDVSTLTSSDTSTFSYDAQDRTNQWSRLGSNGTELDVIEYGWDASGRMVSRTISSYQSEAEGIRATPAANMRTRHSVESWAYNDADHTVTHTVASDGKPTTTSTGYFDSWHSPHALTATPRKSVLGKHGLPVEITETSSLGQVVRKRRYRFFK